MKNIGYVLLVFAAGMAAGYGFWDRSPAPRPPAAPVAAVAVRAEGRVAAYPGAWLTLAGERAGTLVTLNCREQAVMRQGETVAVLRRDEDRAALAEAEAQVAVAEAEARLAAAEVQRAHELAAQGFHSRQAVDRADAALVVARARLASARATERRLAAALDRTVVQAPFAATVVERLASAGEAVAAGQGLCAIADLGRLRIEAEVDEFDAARVRVGDPVRIIAEGYDEAGWPGRVEEIPDAVTRPRLRPQDPARPSDTRVLLVKVALPAGLPLKLGQRVEVLLGRL